MTDRTKRALILTGAGASLDFGAPSTYNLTKSIKAKVLADWQMQHCGGDCAYLKIADGLAGYLIGGADAVNFEHIYHCAHELLATFAPTSGAVNEYRPILQPFIERRIAFDKSALRELVRRMGEFIYAELSAVCEAPTKSLDPLTAFIAKVREDHITRIYTTNYDDFLLQAEPGLYIGFDHAPSSAPKQFDRDRFWQALDEDGLFHLHGSVHLAAGLPVPGDIDLGAFHWFDNRADALRSSTNNSSDEPRMDGGQIIRAPVITGLDKLSRLQQLPFSHYYASMARDAMTADIIYVIGSGLGDLHLNTWLGEARRRKPRRPLVFVDRWPHSFLDDTQFELDRKSIEMLHKLRISIGDRDNGTAYGSGWTLATDRSCAVWDKGFIDFLNAPAELDYILSQLK